MMCYRRTTTYPLACLLAYLLACLLLWAVLLSSHNALAQAGRRGPPGNLGTLDERARAVGAIKGERIGIVQESLAEQIGFRLNTVQDELNLRPDQFNAWAAYADKVKALTADITRERNRAFVKSSTVQQIDGIVDSARNRLTALQDIAASAKALYETLSPEQKPVADARLVTTIPDAFTGRPGVATTR